MRIIVTGASSFLGFHLARDLQAQGFEVIATHQRPLDSYQGVARTRLELVGKGARLVQLDVTDMSSIERVLKEHKIDHWVHHAGFATDYASSAFDLRRAMEVNLFNLDTAFALFHKYNVQSFVCTGSSMEYGNSDIPLTETDACFPATPYGLSKLCTSLRSMALGESYRIPTFVLRIFVPFGVLDAPQKLMPSFFEAVARRQPIDLTPCEQRRDFLHVTEISKAFGAVLKKPDLSLSGIYNVSSGVAVRLKDFLAHVAEGLGADTELCRFGAKEMRGFESLFNAGDPRKFQETFGSPMNLNLGEGIQNYIQSMQDYSDLNL